MHSPHPATNLQVYSAPEIATHYAALDYLTACERFLFDVHIKPGMAILDVGVGGGRTTPYLSRKASRYAGVDYSEEMIRRCRNKFPQLEFVVTDASDLSIFSDASFDAIVIAFNGLDYVLPEEKRWQSLRECHRLLRAEGVLIFSSHNPRAVLVRPDWNREKLRAVARKLAAEESALFGPMLFTLTVARLAHAFLHAVAGSATRVIRRVPKPAFWRGEGSLLDPAHGGLVTHCWVPERAAAELARFDFHLITLLGDDYPLRSRTLVTDWYYYVFSRTKRSIGEGPCV
jgi:ubiquinone/menaquinone biosynthesis C-methylase UbiE